MHCVLCVSAMGYKKYKTIVNLTKIYEISYTLEIKIKFKNYIVFISYLNSYKFSLMFKCGSIKSLNIKINPIWSNMEQSEVQ